MSWPNRSPSQMEKCNEISQQISFIREIEEKNMKMRTVLNSFMKIGSLEEVRKLQEHILREGLVQPGIVWNGIVSQTDLPASGLYDNRVCCSMNEFNVDGKSPIAGKGGFEKEGMGSRDQFTSEQSDCLQIASSLLDNSVLNHSEYEHDTGKVGFGLDQVEILYSVLFEGKISQYFGDRNLVSERDVRDRNILEPFPMGKWVNNSR